MLTTLFIHVEGIFDRISMLMLK